MNALPCPDWLAQWLGIEMASGEGVAWSIRCAWPWGGGWSLLFLVAVALAIVWAYARHTTRTGRGYRRMLLGLRLLVVALLAVMWAQPTLQATRTGLPTLVLLLDDSQSMSLEDHYDDAARAALARVLPESFAAADSEAGGNDASGVEASAPTRWSLLRDALTQRDARRLRELASRYRVEIHWLSSPAPPREQRGDQTAATTSLLAAHQPAGETSPLGNVVRSIRRGLEVMPPAAIVVFSDGVTTAGPPLSEVAAPATGSAVPLFCVGIGESRAPPDIAIHDLVADDVAFVDDIVTLSFEMTGVQSVGKQVRIVLREAGSTRVLAETHVEVEADRSPQDVRLSFRPPRAGRYDLVIAAEPLPDEPQRGNNQLRHELDVRRDKIRVLLVQAYPSYEYRFLRDLLSREPTVALETILQEADPQHADQDASARRFLPSDREEIFRYDCIILGDADPSRWTPAQIEILADYAGAPETRGRLICLAGPRFMPLAYADTPLADVLPIVLRDANLRPRAASLRAAFSVVPTSLGLAFAGMQLADPISDAGDYTASQESVWRSMPELYWRIEAPQVKPGAQVLAVASDTLRSDGSPLPLIARHYVGSGQVLFHAMPTWRWHYRASRALYARYWIQTIHTLCRSNLANGDRAARIVTDRFEYREGETAVIRLRTPESLSARGTDDLVVVLDGAQRGPRRLPMQPVRSDPRWFESRVHDLAPGAYRVSLVAPLVTTSPPPATFTVLPRGDEFARRAMDQQDLQRAAQRSGGKYAPLADVDRLLSDLPRGNRVPLETLPPVPLWRSWPIVLALLGAASLEWWLRKRKNLP